MKRRLSTPAISAGDWKVLLLALWWLPCAGALLRLRGAQKTRRALQRAAAPHPRRPETAAHTLRHAQHVARLVHAVAGRRPFRSRCLTRSLVIEALLHRQGIDCEVKFGARTGMAQFTAHAWVEHDGTALADPGGQDRAIRVLG